MSLEAILIKKPYRISFSKNPMPFSFALYPYGNTEKDQDIRMQVRVMIETNFGSETYVEARSQTFFPNNEGGFDFDVRSTVDAFLQYYLPKLSISKMTQATGQFKRYKIIWTVIQNGLVKSSEESDPLYAIKGGMAYDQWHSEEFLTKKVSVDKQPLHFFPKNQKVFLQDTMFFFWLWNLTDPDFSAEQQVVYHVTHTGGTYDVELPDVIEGATPNLFCVPAGWNQVPGIADDLPDGETVISYWIEVLYPGVGTQWVRSGVYHVDQRNFYNSYQLLYRNSLGGLESVRLRGQVDFKADYSTQQAQRIAPPESYKNLTLLPQILQSASEEVPKFKGDTGFGNMGQIDFLRDLFLSTERYEVVNGKLVPIVINGKTIEFFSNKDNLISLQIEWQRAYVNESFTPASFMPTSRTCPAMEFFDVRQINKRTLQVLWSVSMPYEKVHVQLVYDSNTYNFYYDGNKGSVRQVITLPSDTMTITAKARTVCNDTDFGAFTTISVSYLANRLPVANDDTFNINQGFGTSTTLSPSVLDNDYDPDDDAIAVIASGGATTQGGTYSIDAAGIVVYTPPSTSFVGQDDFDYQIRETPSGTPVTAKVYINVGAAVKVYAKLVIRNITGSDTNQAGDVWVDFFKDPAGISPVDVTGMGIIVSVDQTVHSIDTSVPLDAFFVNTITKEGKGEKLRIYSGTIFYNNPPAAEYHTFDLDFGSGYTII